MHELCCLTATQAVARLCCGEISPIDLVEASIARIEAVDGTVNALPIHCFEPARDMVRNFSVPDAALLRAALRLEEFFGMTNAVPVDLRS